MTDASIMPFGKWKGKRLDEIPDDYLLWFWRDNKERYMSGSPTLNRTGRELMDYIKDSFNEKEL